MSSNLIVGQSGGPTAVINSSLYGILKQAKFYQHSLDKKIDKILGTEYGIEGFLQEKIIDLGSLLDNRKLERLLFTPGSYLGSCRYMLPNDLDDPLYKKLFNNFKKYNIEYFVYCGGNDSMDTVSKISRYAQKIGFNIKVIGVPKTIDNDLVLTDHTPGFGSAAKFVAHTVREIITDALSYEIPSVTIVEIMGRHAGWLTGASTLAKLDHTDEAMSPDFIYLPEVNFELDEFCESIKERMKYKNNVVVCVSEGIHDKNNKLICEYESETWLDNFGHKMLSGTAKFLEKHLKKTLGVKVRSVELNVAQRCSSTLISKTDRDEAIIAGEFAVDSVINEDSGYMVAFVRENSKFKNYKITAKLEDVDNICNKEKMVPLNMINSTKTGMTQDYIDYILPLIQGNIEIEYDKFDLPWFANRKLDKQKC